GRRQVRHAGRVLEAHIERGLRLRGASLAGPTGGGCHGCGTGDEATAGCFWFVAKRRHGCGFAGHGRAPWWCWIRLLWHRRACPGCGAARDANIEDRDVDGTNEPRLRPDEVIE